MISIHFPKSLCLLGFFHAIVTQRLACDEGWVLVEQYKVSCIAGTYLGLSRFLLVCWQALSIPKVGLGRKNNDWTHSKTADALNNTPSALGTAVATLWEGTASDADFWWTDSGKTTGLMLKSSICWGVSLSGKWNKDALISIWHDDEERILIFIELL